MPEWLAYLLRLDQRADQGGLEGLKFALTLDVQPWQWAIAALVCALLAVWSYWKLEGPPAAKLALAGVRAVLLLLVALLLCGPKLVRTSETVEKDWVVLLADRSASMTLADAPPERGAPPGLVSRDAQLRAAVEGARSGLNALSQERAVRWLGFDAGGFPLPVSNGVPDLAAPEGRRSNVGAAIEQALTLAAARPLSGIVVFSDGQSTDQLPRPLLRQLAAKRVGVYVVPLGSAQPLADVSVRTATGPGAAFTGDIVPVEVTVDRLGGGSGQGQAAGTTKVELVDTATNRVLDSRVIDWAAEAAQGGGQAAGAEGGSTRVGLVATPETPGRARWAVRLTPGDGRPDLVPGNDTAEVQIDLTDRPLRVLYLDGYPRWEYRYLKNLLSRERSLAFGALLLSPGRRYVQEGNEPIETVPMTAAEWDRYDVIVLGDLPPTVLSAEQLAQIRRRVTVGGAGLLWIAGPSAVPGTWRRSPLADLLPFSSSGGAGVAAGPGESDQPIWNRDVTLSATPVAQRLNVLRLADSARDPQPWPTAASDPASGWSRLRWVQRIEASMLKPAAEALAMASPVEAAGGTDAPTPAVISMRFGAGRVIYVATDEIWRYRFGRGEDLPERFWMQLIRLLGREAVGRAGKPAIIDVSPVRPQAGQPARVTVTLLDQSLIDASPPGLTLRVAPEAGGAADAGSSTLALKPGEAPASGGESPRRDGATATASGRRTYSTTWVPDRAGVFQLSTLDAILASLGPTAAPTARVQVTQPDDELRRPETNHALLAEVASATGGRVLTAAELGTLGEILPRREIRQVGVAEQHTLWDTPLALMLALGLLAIEWIGRRLIRLI